MGCGIGLQVMLLAEAAEPDGHVTGIDLSLEFLDYARSIAEKAGIPGQIPFEKGTCDFTVRKMEWKGKEIYDVHSCVQTIHNYMYK